MTYDAYWLQELPLPILLAARVHGE
jgi:hypothetical protein